MVRKKKTLKSVKKTPRSLTAREVLGIDTRLHEIALLQKETELKKSQMEVQSLKVKGLLLEAEIAKLQLQSQRAALKEHGLRVMSKEKSSTEFIDELKERYGIEGKLAYDPETFELEEA